MIVIWIVVMMAYSYVLAWNEGFGTFAIMVIIFPAVVTKVLSSTFGWLAFSYLSVPASLAAAGDETLPASTLRALWSFAFDED